MSCICERTFGGEEVPRMALRVPHPTSPHLEDKCKHRIQRRRRPKVLLFLHYANIFSKSLHFSSHSSCKAPKTPAFFLRFKRFGNFEKKFATSNSLKKAVYLRSERFSQISREHPIAHIRDFSYLCRRFLCVYTQLQQRKINLKQYNNGRIKSTSRTTREV